MPRRRLPRFCGRCPFGALLGRAAARDQIVRGVDQGNVGKALREIAELAAGPWVVLFGEQADVVAERQETLE
jgi:hypothetical protein